MPHIDNKVRWCLKKAEREIADGRKHRGLMKIEPNFDEAKKHITKAEHNLKAFIYLAKGNFPDWSVTAGFYVIYHCFLAIILKNGYESRNQECTIALIQSFKEAGKIKIDQKFIDALNSGGIEEMHESNVITLRENFQYGTETSIEDNEIPTGAELRGIN